MPTLVEFLQNEPPHRRGDQIALANDALAETLIASGIVKRVLSVFDKDRAMQPQGQQPTTRLSASVAARQAYKTKGF